MDELFEGIERVSRSRLIVEQIRRALAEGRLKVGDKLPPERELASQLGVSRTSVREAVRILDAYGVLETNHGGGTRVTDRFTENVFDFLGFGSTLNRVNFRHLLQARRIIETGAAEVLVASLPKGALRKLEALVNRLEAESGAERLGLLDARFHETLVELAGNPILTAFYRMIFKMLRQGTERVLSYPEAKAVAVEDHRVIVEAIRREDLPVCTDWIRRHLEHTQALIERYFIENEAG